MYGIWTRLLMAAVAAVVIWMVKVGACMAAVRVHAGSRPPEVDPEELFWRSFIAAAGLTLITPLEILAIDDAFTSGLTSALFWLTIVSVVPLGGLFLQWTYALDDYLSGVGIFLLYSVFPVLFLIACRIQQVPIRKWLISIPAGLS